MRDGGEQPTRARSDAASGSSPTKQQRLEAELVWLRALRRYVAARRVKREAELLDRHQGDVQGLKAERERLRGRPHLELVKDDGSRSERP
jgi:hypothetical protein